MSDEKLKHLENLKEIRSIMERSSTFLSLSGLSGVFAGLSALAGAGFAYRYIYHSRKLVPDASLSEISAENIETLLVLSGIALAVLISALFFGFLFTFRNAKRKKLKIWNKTAKLMIINLLIPLISGGIFILILLFYGIIFLIAGTTLIFYGLALVNAAKYTHKEIRYLGITEILLGIAACFDPGYGLSYWAFGFGVMHILYGTIMYFKYEHKKTQNI